jgi:hypothetical protein
MKTAENDKALQGTLIQGDEMPRSNETKGIVELPEPTALERKWAEKEPASLAPQSTSITPMEMIQIAVRQNADLDKLEKLMALQERWEKNEARKAYDTAMAGFASEPKEIVKNKTVRYKTRDGEVVEYDHASLDNVCEVVGAALSKHGLSFRWQTEQAGDKIKVTCFLQHKQGHGIQVSLEAGPDQSGKKNAIQAVASTITYLERYTLLAATGMATTDQDDDGEASGATEEEQLSKLNNLGERIEWIQNCSDQDELRKIFADAYQAAHKLGDTEAIKALTKAKDKRKAELSPAKGR